MRGRECVKDIQTKDLATEEQDKITWEAVEESLLILAAGQSSLHHAPPLIVTREQADVGLQIFEEALDRVEAEVQW